eukprot:m.22185 g.22185  ORF g.22185 m.22185 type:complete len:224 (+) comp3986_c0_seq1:2965-3636(+)
MPEAAMGQNQQSRGVSASHAPHRYPRSSRLTLLILHQQVPHPARSGCTSSNYRCCWFTHVHSLSCCLCLQGRSRLMDLAGLLTAPLAPSTPSTPGSMPPGDPVKLQSELDSMRKQMAHMTNLLQESEANADRLSEQTKLLKHEMRRLERNDKRADVGTSIEYLKNIFLKFVEYVEEREQLVPVLGTLLQLSPEEMQRLRVCTTSSVAPAANESWASYVQRWAA